jgi:hypothetical protein
MKKTFLILASLFISALTALSQNSDEERILKMNDEHSQETIVSRPDDDTYLKITVTKGTTSGNGNTEVSVKMENLGNSRYILLFGRAWDKDQLRRDEHIIFDNSLGNQKGVDKYNLGENTSAQDIIRIDPDESKTFVLTIKDGEERVCTLPIYFADRNRCKRKRWEILGYETKVLKISIESPVDENYDKLQRQCDSLIRAINGVVFCKSKQHHPSLEKQEEPYEMAIDDLEDEINAILERNHWPKTNQNRKLYEALLNKLDNIFFNEVDDCGDKSLHSAPHSCKYCSKSFKEICSLLESYFMKKDVGETLTRKDKEEVKALYNCCKSGRHATKWKNGADGYKQQIEKYYNAIMKP